MMSSPMQNNDITERYIWSVKEIKKTLDDKKNKNSYIASNHTSSQLFMFRNKNLKTVCTTKVLQ